MKELRKQAIKYLLDGNVEVWVTSEKDTISIRRAKEWTVATNIGFWSDVLGKGIYYESAEDIVNQVFNYLEEESEVVEVEYLRSYEEWQQ